jgi:hypothetical protein
MSQFPPCRRPTRLLLALSWLLALTAAVGATSPRPRTGARDRAGRATILRSGSSRASERQGWVIPDPHGSAVAGDDGRDEPEPGSRAPESLVAVVVPAPPLAVPGALAARCPVAPGRPPRWADLLPSAGRAPPRG